jgi:glycosyltransferase involved in cell wall biosynthesis
MKRVLIVVQNLPVPFDRRVWLEATTLRAAGYAISVICPKAKGFTASFETHEDIDIYRYSVPINASSSFGFAFEFLWCFSRTALLSFRVAMSGRGFDILHACNPPETYWLLGAFWQLFGKVFVFDHHDLSPEMFRAKFGRGGILLKLLLWFERRTFRFADLIITTNQSHKDIAIKRGGRLADDVYIVRSGPLLSRFARYAPDPVWRRGKTHLIAYLGEICVQDGVDHLVRAVKQLTERHDFLDFHCVLVGGGPHQPFIKAYAQELGVGEFCTFTGRVSDEDLCRVLSSADIAVDPDPKNEWTDKSTMNKIIEYMYFGLPIVCYDLREARVSAEAAAEYVKPNDEEALACGVMRLLADAQARERMSAIGIARVETALAWDYSAPILLAAYERASGLARARRSGRANDGQSNYQS